MEAGRWRSAGPPGGASYSCRPASDTDVASKPVGCHKQVRRPRVPGGGGGGLVCMWVQEKSGDGSNGPGAGEIGVAPDRVWPEVAGQGSQRQGWSEKSEACKACEDSPWKSSNDLEKEGEKRERKGNKGVRKE